MSSQVQFMDLTNIQSPEASTRAKEEEEVVWLMTMSCPPKPTNFPDLAEEIDLSAISPNARETGSDNLTDLYNEYLQPDDNQMDVVDKFLNLWNPVSQIEPDQYQHIPTGEMNPFPTLNWLDPTAHRSFPSTTDWSMLEREFEKLPDEITSNSIIPSEKFTYEVPLNHGIVTKGHSIACPFYSISESLVAETLVNMLESTEVFSVASVRQSPAVEPRGPCHIDTLPVEILRTIFFDFAFDSFSKRKVADPCHSRSRWRDAKSALQTCSLWSNIIRPELYRAVNITACTFADVSEMCSRCKQSEWTIGVPFLHEAIYAKMGDVRQHVQIVEISDAVCIGKRPEVTPPDVEFLCSLPNLRKLIVCPSFIRETPKYTYGPARKLQTRYIPELVLKTVDPDRRPMAYQGNTYHNAYSFHADEFTRAEDSWMTFDRVESLALDVNKLWPLGSYIDRRSQILNSFTSLTPALRSLSLVQETDSEVQSWSMYARQEGARDFEDQRTFFRECNTKCPNLTSLTLHLLPHPGMDTSISNRKYGKCVCSAIAEIQSLTHLDLRDCCEALFINDVRPYKCIKFQQLCSDFPPPRRHRSHLPAATVTGNMAGLERLLHNAASLYQRNIESGLRVPLDIELSLQATRKGLQSGTVPKYVFSIPAGIVQVTEFSKKAPSRYRKYVDLLREECEVYSRSSRISAYESMIRTQRIQQWKVVNEDWAHSHGKKTNLWRWNYAISTTVMFSKEEEFLIDAAAKDKLLNRREQLSRKAKKETTRKRRRKNVVLGCLHFDLA